MTLAARNKIWLLAGAFVIAGLVWAAGHGMRPAADGADNLAADLPPGALLTIESPDFARLLHTWTTSPEEQGWLRSANYSAFVNSRLFPRLAEAQGAFAGSAGVPLGAQFLEQVAGQQSIFAWYDIGNLEFLYITHLPAGRAATIDLLQQEAKFSRRTAGDTTFYLRTAAGCSDSTHGQSCTVAFATRGDLLLLATREDLIANALLLMQHSSGQSAPSMAQEGWFAAATAAGPSQHGELHMLLDLQRLTKTPQFRTYWVQRNVSDTRRFRAAVVDLYREPGRFREERTLLPMVPDASAIEEPDLAGIEALLPVRAGVYRIVALPTAAAALASLEEKVLARTTTSTFTSTASPYADLSVPEAGSSSDFETRIDAPAIVVEPPDAALEPLKRVLAAAKITAMVTLDRTDPPSAAGELFVPIHSAVILRREGPWDADALASALLDALGARLSTGRLGLAWTPVTTRSGSYRVMSATQPLALAIAGDTAILTTDAALMTDMLLRHASANPQPDRATLIAEFRLDAERASFLRLTGTLDGATLRQNAQPGSMAGNSDAPAQPAFFRDNLGSLGQTFAALDSERVEEHRVESDSLIRQTVVYNWRGR
jgi:hypothetical protein